MRIYKMTLVEVRHYLVAFLLTVHESPSGALTRLKYLLYYSLVETRN